MTQLIQNQQFTVDRMKSFHMPGIPRTHGWITADGASKDAPRA
jgi:hypothetical protein